MRAAVLKGVRELHVVDDWPEPVAGPQDVIIEVTGLGICGSDLAVWSGMREPAELPWVIGHEAIGRIVEVGSEVPAQRLGERVVIEPNYPCGRCPTCRSGRTSTCPNRGIVGINAPGLLRERAAVPSQFAWAAPDGLTDADLVCVEPVAVANTAMNTSGLGAGGRCLVIGAGAQGLFVCQLATAAGASVAVIEPQEGRLELATKLGASRGSTDDRYPIVFETSGTSGGVRSALELVDAGGTVVLIGIPHDDVPVPIDVVVRNQIRVIGSLIYDHPRGFQQTLALMASHRLVPSSVLGEPFSLDRAPQAMAAAATFPGKSWITLA